jgi:hypothetical protein
VLGNGSIGLIPAYLGATVGMVGFVMILYRSRTVWAAVVAGIGVVGMFTFWYTYPARATLGGMGSILIGMAIILSFPAGDGSHHHSGSHQESWGYANSSSQASTGVP